MRLSPAAALGSWAGLVASLLRDGCGLTAGARAAVLLPPHWQTAAVLFGGWSIGPYASASPGGTTYDPWATIARGIAESLDLHPGDRILLDAAEHEQPVGWLLAPLSAGATIVLCANLDHTTVDERVAAEGVTRVPQPGSVYPVWWTDCPARLKDWFDRVWTVGYRWEAVRTAHLHQVAELARSV